MVSMQGSQEMRWWKGAPLQQSYRCNSVLGERGGGVPPVRLQPVECFKGEGTRDKGVFY